MVLAHNADWLVWDDDTLDVFGRLGADPLIHELALDRDVLGDSTPEESENVLPDGVHWSVGGHSAVADSLERFLARPEISRSTPPPEVVGAEAAAQPSGREAETS